MTNVVNPMPYQYWGRRNRDTVSYWLAVQSPSWKIWVRQWGWHYPIYEMENNPVMFETTNQGYVVPQLGKATAKSWSRLRWKSAKSLVIAMRMSRQTPQRRQTIVVMIGNVYFEDQDGSR